MNYYSLILSVILRRNWGRSLALKTRTVFIWDWFHDTATVWTMWEALPRVCTVLPELLVLNRDKTPRRLALKTKTALAEVYVSFTPMILKWYDCNVLQYMIPKLYSNDTSSKSNDTPMIPQWTLCTLMIHIKHKWYT